MDNLFSFKDYDFEELHAAFQNTSSKLDQNGRIALSHLLQQLSCVMISDITDENADDGKIDVSFGLMHLAFSLFAYMALCGLEYDKSVEVILVFMQRTFLGNQALAIEHNQRVKEVREVLRQQGGQND